MPWMIWDRVKRAAQLFAAAKDAPEFTTRVNLQRAACDLLGREAAMGAEHGPSWADVLVAHSR